jgi:DNA-binding transcriptional LysR family regulator
MRFGFDQTDLRLLVLACERGTLTAASAELHMTLAAASARLRRMEERAGGPLLVRHARGVLPTAAGRRLLVHARAVLVRLEGFSAEEPVASSPADSLEGAVVVLANTSALARMPAAPMAELVTAHPDLQLAVRESTSHRSVQALGRHTAQVALMSGAVRAPGFVTRRLTADPLVAVVPRRHPLASRLSVRLPELLDSPWVGLPPGRAITDHLLWQAARRGLALPLRVQVPAIAQVLQLVECGAGVSVLPRMAVARCGLQADVRVLELDEPWARRELLLCALPGVMKRGRLRRFAGELGDALVESA